MRLPRGRGDWTGAVAFVVALFVSLGWACAMVAAALDDDVSAQGIQLLAALGGVLAGSVAGYLGGAIFGRRRPDDFNDSEEVNP